MICVCWSMFCLSVQQMSNIASEKEKLATLEQSHRTAVKQLQELSSSADATADQEQTEMLRQRVMDEQDAVDNQKFLVDNLEFQQLEVCWVILALSASERCLYYNIYHV